MLGLTAEAVHLRIGVPGPDSTQIADLARFAAPRAGVRRLPARHHAVAAVGEFVIPGRAGPAQGARRRTRPGEPSPGILPAALGRTNSHYTPYWGVLVFVVGSAALATASGGNDQRLVLFYAVAVFLSFLAGMLAMTRLSYRARQPATLAVNATGALVVGFTLAVNLARGAPLASMAATGLIALILHRLWVRSGRPSGTQQASVNARRLAPHPAWLGVDGAMGDIEVGWGAEWPTTKLDRTLVGVPGDLMPYPGTPDGGNPWRQFRGKGLL